MFFYKFESFLWKVELSILYHLLLPSNPVLNNCLKCWEHIPIHSSAPWGCLTAMSWEGCLPCVSLYLPSLEQCSHCVSLGLVQLCTPFPVLLKVGFTAEWTFFYFFAFFYRLGSFCLIARVPVFVSDKFDAERFMKGGVRYVVYLCWKGLRWLVPVCSRLSLADMPPVSNCLYVTVALLVLVWINPSCSESSCLDGMKLY